MKKIVFILTFFLTICYSITSYGTETNSIDTNGIIEKQEKSLGITEFIKESKEYVGESFSDVDLNTLYKDAISGDINLQGFLGKVIKLTGKEVASTIRSLGYILVIIIIHSIIKNISDGLGNNQIGEITHYVVYILIVTLIMTNFSEMINLIRETTSSLVGFLNSLLPILLSLMITTGNIVTASTIQPILLMVITFIGNFISSVLLPLILIGTALGIISKISDKVQISKLSKFFKSSVVWVLGIVLTIFVGILSLEGTLTSSVDGLTAKTTKAVVTSTIPVVGKILGETVDAVLGCSNILKNAVGFVGIFVVISISILPIIKLAIMSISFNLTAALSEPIADKKIVSVLEQMGDTFKVLLGMVIAISVMLIIGLTLVIKITNSGMMYR